MKLRRLLNQLNAYIGRRKSKLAVMTLVLFILLAIYNVIWVSSSPEDNLSHFRHNRSLEHYFKNIKVLIEPSGLSRRDFPVLILVNSSPASRKNRDAIRETWGKQYYYYTYFVMGVDGNVEQDHNTAMKDLISESNYFKDIVVYDFKDHYQNLTLKTALMMKWTVDRYPGISFFIKVDDDVLVNPWTLKKVWKRDFEWIGYVTKNVSVYRNEGSKWYLPRWLYPEDMIPQFVSGPIYIVKGEKLDDILNAAFEEPLHNLEDVYFSYNVVTKRLGLNLTHDHRLSPFRPWPTWLPLPCAYWNLASVHSVTPDEMRHLWTYIEKIKEKININPEGDICDFYNTYLQSYVLRVMEYRRYTSQ